MCLIFVLFMLTPLAVGIAHVLQRVGLPDFDGSGVTLLVLSYLSALLIAIWIYRSWPRIRRFV